MKTDYEMWEYIKRFYTTKAQLVVHIRQLNRALDAFLHMEEIGQLKDYLGFISTQLSTEVEAEKQEAEIIKRQLMSDNETHLMMYTLLLYSADNNFDSPQYKRDVMDLRMACVEYYGILRTHGKIANYSNFSDMLPELLAYFIKNNIDLVAAVELFPALKSLYK